jgi:hypothetical protein
MYLDVARGRVSKPRGGKELVVAATDPSLKCHQRRAGAGDLDEWGQAEQPLEIERPGRLRQRSQPEVGLRSCGSSHSDDPGVGTCKPVDTLHSPAMPSIDIRAKFDE